MGIKEIIRHRKILRALASDCNMGMNPEYIKAKEAAEKKAKKAAEKAAKKKNA